MTSRLLTFLFGILLALATGGVMAQEASPQATSTAVEREVLAASEPDAAPDEIFELARYTIAPGAVLPVHTHPGVQMATVESGTLSYHVVSDGEVAITRADGTQETGMPGDTLTFAVGDAWVEPEGMVHWAENTTSEPVVLLATSLFAEGEPTSTVVEATPGD